jgi:hypothetical protein
MYVSATSVSKNFAVCPQNLFVGFFYFSEQRAAISLSITIQLVVEMETQFCVLWGMNWILNIIYVILYEKFVPLFFILIMK